LEVAVEQYDAGKAADLGGDVVEEPAVGGPERLPSRHDIEQEVTDGLPDVDEGHLGGGAAWVFRSGAGLVQATSMAQLDGHIREPRGVRQSLDGPGQMRHGGIVKDGQVVGMKAYADPAEVLDSG